MNRNTQISATAAMQKAAAAMKTSRIAFSRTFKPFPSFPYLNAAKRIRYV